MGQGKTRGHVAGVGGGVGEPLQDKYERETVAVRMKVWAGF